MVHTRDYKTMTVVVGVIAAMLLIALFALTVIEGVEYQRQANFENLPDYTYVFYSVAPLSLAAIAGGFWLMRRGPTLCVLLVTSGSIALAIMTYWLIVPVLLAIGVSFSAIHRAYRIQARV